DQTAALWTAIQPQLQALRGWLATHLPAALAGLQSVWSTVWSALPGVAQTAQSGVQSAWAALMQLLEPALKRLRASFSNLQAGVGQLGPQFQGLLAAVQNVWTALQPILTLLGQLISAVIGGVAVVAVNLLAATFNHLAGIASTVIDQLTLLLNTLATVITEVVNLVTALLQGDWSAAWQSAQNIAFAFAQAVTGSVRNLWRVVRSVFSLIFETILNTLEDLGLDADAALATLQTTFDTAWSAIQTAVTTAIDTILGVFETMEQWLTSTLQSAVNGFRTFLQGVTLPNPFAALESAIAAIQTALDTVRQKIEDFKNWIGGISIPNPFGGLNLPGIPGFAAGTAFAPGGLALVGERGPELIELPRGARVYDAAETRQMMGEGLRMENHYHLYNDLDVESVARRVAQLMQWRGR
ncbi:MAG TPA: hypothetical protein VNK95_13155, partial [Caldilineaceae bacterium]|nr:hypothetical protein [Caldilineaceae bacterium]